MITLAPIGRLRGDGKRFKARGVAWAIPDYIIWQNVPGDLALLDARDGSYHALNDSAADIFRAVAAGMTQAHIAVTLAERHDSPQAVIAEDVASFLADLHARGLLTCE